MARKKKEIPTYGTVVLKGVEYYRTRIEDADEMCIRDRLTEGPMKADVIHYLTGQTVLAVAGVNSLTQLELILPQLHEQGVEPVSYTHLDVYKRQGGCHPPGRRRCRRSGRIPLCGMVLPC